MLSDPESLQQIKELADMLRSEGVGEGEKPDNNSVPGAAPDLSALMSMLGGMTGGSPQGGSSVSGLDTETVMGLIQAISAAGGEDKDRRLLMALKPHVSAERQTKIDRAVKLMKLYAVVSTLKDSGMLGKLDKLI